MSEIGRVRREKGERSRMGGEECIRLSKARQRTTGCQVNYITKQKGKKIAQWIRM